MKSTYKIAALLFAVILLCTVAGCAPKNDSVISSTGEDTTVSEQEHDQTNGAAAEDPDETIAEKDTQSSKDPDDQDATQEQTRPSDSGTSQEQTRPSIDNDTGENSTSGNNAGNNNTGDSGDAGGNAAAGNGNTGGNADEDASEAPSISATEPESEPVQEETTNAQDKYPTLDDGNLGEWVG